MPVTLVGGRLESYSDINLRLFADFFVVLLSSALSGQGELFWSGSRVLEEDYVGSAPRLGIFCGVSENLGL